MHGVARVRHTREGLPNQGNQVLARRVWYTRLAYARALVWRWGADDVPLGIAAPRRRPCALPAAPVGSLPCHHPPRRAPPRGPLTTAASPPTGTAHPPRTDARTTCRASTTSSARSSSPANSRPAP